MSNTIYIAELLKLASCNKSLPLRTLRKAALQIFEQYMGCESFSADQLTKENIEDFSTWLIKTGKSLKTVELYRNEIRAVILEKHPESEQIIKAAFAQKAGLRCAKSAGLGKEQMRKIAKATFTDRADLTEARDLFLFCFYVGGITYGVVKELTTEMLDGSYLTLPSDKKVRLNINIESIVDTYASDTDNRLFPFLSQMNEARYSELLKEIAERYRMPRLKERHAEAKAWITIAKEIGVELSVIAAVAYKQVGVLTHYSGEISTDQKEEDKAVGQVSLAVADNTERWYAMKMRSKVRLEDITTILYNNPKYPALRNLITYYPMEDIESREGKRLIQKTKAYIDGVVFFRTASRFVAPLFSLIREKAWIYRQSNAPSSPYAVISQNEMENFQRAISCFTDDIEVTIVENASVCVGQKVRLTAGRFAGCEGIIEQTTEADQSSNVRNFIVRFTTENSFKFKIEASEVQMIPIE